jgi:hypothetical protein
MIVLVLSVGSASAQLIDFETTPPALGGGVPVNDGVLPVAAPYVFPGLTVSFGFDLDGNGSVESDAVFEHTGVDAFPPEPPNGGFEGFGLVADTPDPLFAAQLGQWFLRSPNPGQPIGRFVIQYGGSLAVTAASGEIWDIDGNGAGATEQYLVEAFDSSSSLLGSQLSPLGTLPSALAPLNARPWVFGFSGLSAPLDHIVITFVGTKTQGIGLAFNNFNPTTVPEPASGLLLGVAGLAAMHRRRRAA